MANAIGQREPHFSFSPACLISVLHPHTDCNEPSLASSGNAEQIIHRLAFTSSPVEASTLTHEEVKQHSKLVGIFSLINLAQCSSMDDRDSSATQFIQGSAPLSAEALCIWLCQALFAYKTDPFGSTIHLSSGLAKRNPYVKPLTYIATFDISAKRLNLVSLSWMCFAEMESCSVSCSWREISCSKIKIDAAVVASCLLHRRVNLS